MKRLVVQALLILIIVSGCGPYSFSPSGKSAFQSVYVAQFENNTIQYEMGDRLTDAVIDAFVLDNTVQVKESDKAEAVLNGTVISYRRDPHTFDQQDNVTKYAVKVSLRVKIAKANTEDIIWEETFYAEGVYDANTETEEGEGQDRVISLLTADILDKTTKSW
ncbi:MAG: LptE family protein [candidate division Zixibacteria bacterium]